MNVALATGAAFVDVDADLPRLVAALPSSTVAVWDDPDVDWSSFDGVVVRSTWDYIDRRDEFLAWAALVESATRLANPAGVIRWNSSKRYLAELAAAGIPVVPTVWPADGQAVPPWWDDIVVKPAVSAGSRWTGRYHDADAAAAFARRLLARGDDVLVQPYVGAVDRVGEVGVFFFGGRPSHAIRKGAVLAPGAEPVASYELAAGQRFEPVALADAPVEFARSVLEAVPADLLYARVDCVTGDDGAELLLEVELVEPSLFLETSEGAAGRFAEAVTRWLAG